MTRIVIDIAYAFNENFSKFNMTAISPSYPFIVYKAAMEHLLVDNVGGDKWMKDFSALRKCCWYFSHRWTIASTSPRDHRFPGSTLLTADFDLGAYLETLEQTAEAAKVGPLPSVGDFVCPMGVLSGLC
jgi:hypothetical protein